VNALKRIIAGLAALLMLGAAVGSLAPFMMLLSTGLGITVINSLRAGMPTIAGALAIALGAHAVFLGSEWAWRVAKGPADSVKPSGLPGFMKIYLAAGLISLPAGVSIMKVREIETKRLEGAVKGNLGTIRSALSIYYGDMEGLYPDQPAALTVSGKYLRSIPSVWSGGDTSSALRLHKSNSEAAIYQSMEEASDTGKWGYINNGVNANYGSFFVDCTHTDTKGTVWTSY
jgi:hypothetical protein